MNQFLRNLAAKAALGTLVISAVTVSSVETSAATTSGKPCLVMGAAVSVAHKPVSTCAAFYKKGTAIHIVKDIPTTRYGIVLVPTTRPAQSAVLINRDGAQTTMPIKFVPTGLRSDPVISQYIFRATLRKGKIIGLKPFLFVPTETMVKPFAQSQFIGTVHNMSPASGIASTAWMRWNFTNIDVEHKLQGRFVNLNSAVRASPILEPPAPCRAPLNNGGATSAWYSKTLGTSESMTMFWDPAMHAPMDSELVVVTGSGVSYMTSAPSINTLLKAKLDTTRDYSFTIHGNPMGTPYQFTGSFTALTTVRSCTL